MSFEKIISISGKSGLFEVLSQNKNNLLVQSLSDNKKFPVYASHKVSALSDISIYTLEDELPLKEVYKTMAEKLGDTTFDKNAEPAALRAQFEEIVPDYDAERVYNSDLKKLFNWFYLLKENDMLDFSEEEETTEAPKGE